MSTCVSCLDEGVVFTCKGAGGTCSYKLCAGCIRIAFDDNSGASSSFCAMCKTPSALDMIAAVCGKGAIIAVKEKIRGEVEFQCEAKMLRREASRTNAHDMSEKARKMFNDLADKLNLRCPRCEAAFHDYDGCNALTCSIPECRAAFCAICLIDCGNDAHGHVRIAHGDLFDKSAFHTSTNIRAKAQIEILKDKLSHESFELRQLVMNHIEKAKLMQDSISHNNASARTAAFLEKSKASLSLAVRSDRLALLNDPEVYGREQITPENISPRCVIPSDYRLSLTPTEEDIYQILLEHNSRPDTWIRIDDIEAHFKENPKIESLLNVFQALHCAVIAFDGKAVLYQSSRGTVSGRRQIAKGEVCIRLRAIDRYGNVRIDDDVHYGRMNIIGLNQNMRLLDLEKYVQNASQSDLMFESLQHFVGVGLPRALITEMDMDPPDSYLDLNEEQKKVAHPLRLKTAMEVAGPPGTGKTKTIIELVRGLLQCTNYDILVLSERNGAINAVAEKFKSESINMKEKKIIDLQVWQSVMTYGAGDTMGDSTKLFTLEQKLDYHPELISLQNIRKMLKAASEKLSQVLRSKISETVLGFGLHFNDEDSAAMRSEEIEKNTVELSTPIAIIDAVEQATLDIKDLLETTTKQDSKYVPEKESSNVINRHSTLLGRLVYIRPDSDRDNNEIAPWDAKGATMRLRYILDRFGDVLKLSMFSPENARDLYKEKAAADEEYKAVRSRLETELPALARLHMSTIGSSHRLTTAEAAEEINSDDDLSCTFGQLSLNDDKEVHRKETICIFDESGCIPAYELLGLTRLGRSIKALILVGDKHQLPPYDPTQGRSFGRRNSFGNATRDERSKSDEKMQSLLDVSALTIDSGKVMLTTQYRVPRDIAEMLNSRVYRGNYKTCPKARVPMSGLKMVNVPWKDTPRRKYVNPNEVDEGIRLVEKLSSDKEISNIMVITPYKNQQREFEFKLKNRKHTSEITVLTIDQCQGQEADAVILSLVRRPTRFLTLNRLNVAMSRVRKRLYILTDFKDLQEACRDTNWDSARLASDLLISDT